MSRRTLTAALYTATFAAAAAPLSAQRVASVLFPEDPTHGVVGSFAGEMEALPDTLTFWLESGSIRNTRPGDLGSARVASITLALREVHSDGSWTIVYRGWARKVDASVEAGAPLELEPMMLGIIEPGLDLSGDLRPLIEIDMPHARGSAHVYSFLDVPVSRLFRRPGRTP